MHFHLPKPLHGWREFAGEVGIIVIGVLIALTFEQVAEGMRWRSAVTESEASMRKELAEDDGPQVFERLAFSPCITAQLDALQAGLVTERAAGVPFRPAPLVVPSYFTWDSDAYRQALASNTLSHMTTERAYAWSSPYTLMADMDAANVRENGDYAELQMLSSAPDHPSEQMRAMLLSAIAKARGDNKLMTLLATKFVAYSSEPGINFTPDEKRLLITRDKAVFPACAKAAAPRWVGAPRH
jgi:hypothetical protein